MLATNSFDPATAVATALAMVTSSGTQRAGVWVAIHGSEARSSRMLRGRNDVRNAVPMPIRAEVAPGFVAAGVLERPVLVAGTAAPSSSIDSSGAVAAR